jgi:hypothetical protein
VSIRFLNAKAHEKAGSSGWVLPYRRHPSSQWG